eukprot:scaffold21502_cov63-Phaeocystis_antarctica.AAC.2
MAPHATAPAACASAPPRRCCRCRPRRAARRLQRHGRPGRAPGSSPSPRRAGAAARGASTTYRRAKRAACAASRLAPSRRST